MDTFRGCSAYHAVSAVQPRMGNILQLPFNSIVEEFKVSHMREALQYRGSRDSKISAAGIKIQTGRKWSAPSELATAEEGLRHRAVVGVVVRGRAGFGCFPSPQYSKAQGQEQREPALEEVGAAERGERNSKMAGMKQQGACMRWEYTLEWNLTWADICQAEPRR